MTNLNAKFASAVVTCLVAGAPFTAAPKAANAAECLTEPRQDRPQGQHWFYRIEHGTKRHCWYLRDDGGKVSHATPSNDSRTDVVARKDEPNQRSLEDARAEWAVPSLSAQDNVAVAPTQAAPTPAPPSVAALASSPSLNPQQSEPQRSAVASAEGSVQASIQASGEKSTVSSRWPTPSGSASSTTTRLAAANTSDPHPDTQAAAAPAPPLLVNSPAEKAKPTASLQMLLLVILGALALAGLTASVIYRFGHRRRTVRMNARERRAAIRESFDNASNPPWAEFVIEKTARTIEKTAPPSERTAPPIKKTARSIDKKAAPPIEKTGRPIATTPPPVEKKTAPPIAKTARPIEKTAAPIAKTAAPIAKTAQPAEKIAPQPYPARSPVQTGRAQERYADIEEILAQLVKQADA